MGRTASTRDYLADAGRGGADTPLVVQCIYESEWQVNKTAQEVIQAIQNGRSVQYFVKDSNGWGSGIISSTSSNRVELLVIRDYLDGDFFVDKLSHIDGNIHRNN